jgi:hypothetical protein
MGVRQTLMDFNTAFASVANPVILNDLKVMTGDQRAKNEDLTTTIYAQTDVFSNEPKCDCEAITGAYNEGIVCPDCGTPVQDKLSKDLEFKVWFRAPRGVVGLISPLVWVKMVNRFKKDEFSIFRWLSNPDYVPPKEVTSETISRAIELGIPRGYNHLVTNLLPIYDTIFESRYFNVRKGPKEDDPLRRLLATRMNMVLTNYLPMPNKALVVREKTATSKEWSDGLTIDLIDILKTVSGIDSDPTRFNDRQLENRTAKVIDKLGCEWFHNVVADFISKKPGLARKNLYGLRVHFSARGVISSLTEEHRYGTILLPWGISLSLFKEHLVAVLLRTINENTGFLYTPNEAIGLLVSHSDIYNKKIADILDSFIANSPDNAIPCFFVRNPTLGRPSTQLMYIAGFKKDPADITISLSILSIIGFNADFDGDTMALMLLLDWVMTKMMEPLLPHKSYISTSEPFKLSGVDNLPKPVGANLVKFINTHPEHVYTSAAEVPVATQSFLNRLRCRVIN